MSLIDIRMDHHSITIDGYDVGVRAPPGAKRVLPRSTWDEVRAALDGFDIDQPAKDAARIAQLEAELLQLLDAAHQVSDNSYDD